MQGIYKKDSEYARSILKHRLLHGVSGLNLKVIVIDVGSREVRNPVFIRAEQGWRVADLKTEIAEVRRCGIVWGDCEGRGGCGEGEYCRGEGCEMCEESVGSVRVW